MARGRKPSSQTVSTGIDITKIDDDVKITLVNAKKAGRKTVTSEGEILFDENGKVEVSGKLAKILLTIPGYEVFGAKEVVETTTENSDEETETVETTEE
jgi:hypothetical protein